MILPKPAHLGPDYAAQFGDASVVEAYHHRPPYPAQVFQVLDGLVKSRPRVVLDVGCGTGDIARHLVKRVDRVDALDISPGMIEKGKGLANGGDPKLNWICGSVEDAPLAPPYGLVTAGESLHWMEWEVVLPRFRDVLVPQGYLAIIERVEAPTPWHEDLMAIIPEFSTNKDFRPYNLVEELELRGLFRREGVERTVPVAFTQTISSYIESFHSRNGFSRERMSAEAATKFDAKVRECVWAFCGDGVVELQVGAEITWGTPGWGVS